MHFLNSCFEISLISIDSSWDVHLYFIDFQDISLISMLKFQ